MRATSFLFIKRYLAVLLPISIQMMPRVMMLLRRRHEILRFYITELILSVMTELSNLLIRENAWNIDFFTLFISFIFISSFSENWEGLISTAAPVECGMGRAVAPAAPPPGSASAWYLLFSEDGGHLLWLDFECSEGDMVRPEGGALGRLRSVNMRTGGGSENHTGWRGGGHIMPPIDLSSYES